MKNSNCSYLPFIISLFTVLTCTLPVNVQAQPGLRTSPPTDTLNEFLISYNIVTKGQKGDHIAETYNGGVKTIFIQNEKVRLRQVSLMRTQSIFYSYKPGRKGKIAVVVKESGANRYKFYLNEEEWKVYNKNSDSVTCELDQNGSIIILDKVCKKAVVTVGGTSKLMVWYYPKIYNTVLANAEPVFRCIPGIVLKYIYKAGNKSLEYTAERFETKPIALSAFAVPEKGYKIIRYKPGRKQSEIPEIIEEADEGE